MFDAILDFFEEYRGYRWPIFSVSLLTSIILSFFVNGSQEPGLLISSLAFISFSVNIISIIWIFILDIVKLLIYLAFSLVLSGGLYYLNLFPEEDFGYLAYLAVVFFLTMPVILFLKLIITIIMSMKREEPSVDYSYRKDSISNRMNSDNRSSQDASEYYLKQIYKNSTNNNYVNNSAPETPKRKPEYVNQSKVMRDNKLKEMQDMMHNRRLAEKNKKKQ